MENGKDQPMAIKSFTAVILGDDNTSMTGFEVPFDPKAVFGKVRAPVVVAIGKHTYRSTICSMGGKWMIPLRRSNRDAAGVVAGDRVRVSLRLDDAPRTVTPPKDLVQALRAAGGLPAFRALSYTHQREHVEAIEQAKKPETRAKRIENCLKMVRAKDKKR